MQYCYAVRVCKPILSFIILLRLAFLDAGCASENLTAEQMAYIEEIESYRTQKDAYFKNSPRTPLTTKDQQTFKELTYFPVQPKFAIKLRLIQYDVPDTIYISATDGSKKQALRYGYFKFQLDNRTNKLFVYNFIDGQSMHENYLFIPFLDPTNGISTYGGGRFLDLQEIETQEYLVDFNLAYNPYCAYGDNSYICPMPPEENTLNTPITAGEKMPVNAHQH